MSIIKRGATYHTRFKFKGELYQKSLHTKSKVEAVKLESLMRAALVRGEYGILDSSLSPTLAQFEDRLLPHLRANCKPRSVAFYAQSLVALKKFAPMAKAKLSHIDQSLIEKFVQHRLGQNLAVATVNNNLRTLNRALTLAKEWKLISAAPRVRLLPREGRREYVISDKDVALLSKVAAKLYPKSQMSSLIPFLVDCGLRISEACALVREDVEQEQGRAVAVRVTQGKSRFAKREIPLTARASAAVAVALGASRCDYVWTSQQGKHPLDAHHASKMFRETRDAAGLDRACCLHSTRHTFASKLGNAGVDIAAIQSLCGHSTITMSARYVHSDKTRHRAAIETLGPSPAIPVPFSGTITI